MEHSNSEERDQIDRPPVRQEDESADTSREGFQSDDWWRASPPASDWAEPVTEGETAEVARSPDSEKADVYFCGRTNLFPLNLAIRAIGKENLTGLLQARWDREPIDVLARDGEIVLSTTRDPELYCPDTPAILASVDTQLITNAREQQKENGIPFLLTLARNESVERQPALDLMRRYGQMLFSQLWLAPNVWIMFQKDTDLLSSFGDVTGDPDVDDWSLETLRLVQGPDQLAGFDPGSIPSFTRGGFDRVQKLKLTSDEAQFASQFNGARSVQQIAKNLRLDLKSARQLLFRFVALEIIECWPGSTAAKPEPKGGFGRFFGRGR
ncbi:MAG TPA: hypothetical protein VFQ78_04630 [Candidatus Udaeobacter sp.]|jgi:hypothetical protein|nr:hypothetical protein [Candidatus Udaeobacter sp.]